MKLFKSCAAAAALALMASAGAASAQEADWSFNIAGTTDYVFRGFSQTQEDPALQGGVDVTVGNIYAGAWASNVDFGDDTNTEIDLYTGYRGEAAGFGYDVGVVGYFYVDEPSGADYTYVEFKAAASRAFGPVSVGGVVYYSPDFTGPVNNDDGTYVEGNVSYALMDRIGLSAAYGKQYVDDLYGDDYETWNAGATFALIDNIALDVRYYDTDVDGVAIADDRVVGTLKYTF